MIAQIIINSNAKDLNKTFDYEVPKELERNIKIGSRVLVPFGKMKKLEEGYVIAFKEVSEYKLKTIAKIEDGDFLKSENVKLAKWMARRYFCNISDAIKLMLPPGATTKKIEKRIKDKSLNFVYLKKNKEEIEFELQEGKIKSDKQKRVLNILLQGDEINITDLSLISDASKSIIKTLEKNGYIDIMQKKVDRDPFINKRLNKSNKLEFTSEQQEAYEKIEEAIEDNMNSEFLVFGVTGSRKNRNLSSSNRKSIKSRKR